MATITRSEFLQNFRTGIDLNAAGQTLNPTARARLQALDTNGDGLVQGQTSLGDAWRIIDSFDNNGRSASISSLSPAGDVLRALTPVAVGAGTTVTPGERVKQAALTRAANDSAGYAYDNAPTSPFINLSGNRTPGVSRPSWLANNNKCNQFVGDALARGGMRMPTFAMTDGSEHYVNAEKLPTFTRHFDRITDPAQIRPGDIFVVDYPGTGLSTAHTEVITAYDAATGDFKTTGAHSDGAYEKDRPAWMQSMTYDAANQRWDDGGSHLYILRPKMPARSGTVSPRG
jgi:hypothetical protein